MKGGIKKMKIQNISIEVGTNKVSFIKGADGEIKISSFDRYLTLKELEEILKESANLKKIFA